MVIEQQRMRILIRLLITCYVVLSDESYVPSILLVVGCLPYLWTSLAEGLPIMAIILARYRILGVHAGGRKIWPILKHCPSGQVRTRKILAAVFSLATKIFRTH
jgi:hypothetical protein